MVSQNKTKIWLGITRIGLAAGIFVTSVMWASAQSTSTNYKAVDFVNPEGSLSASSSYKLNDSIDYYGGVNASTSYVECTGDHAVLSACGSTVTPPPPPPPPGGGGGGIGAGGDHPDHQDCNKLDCITEDDEPPVEVEPEKPIKPFVLPNIKEPVALAPVVQPPIVEPARVTPALVNKVIEKVIEEVLPNEPLCQDLICAQASILIAQGEKLRGAAENVCTVYTYGGFAFRGGCENIVFFWVTSIVIATLGAAGETVRRERKKKILN